MANFVFNIAKGRVVEYYNRVESNDPANSAFVIVALQATGIEADATLQDYANLSLLLAGASNEAVNTPGYERKVLTNTELAALPAPDNTDNWYEVTVPNQTWTAVPDTGNPSTNPWGKLLICYNSDTVGNTDVNIIPMTAHDFAVTPDGSDIVMQVGADGFFRAA